MTTKNISCPACETGQLKENTCAEEFEYKGNAFIVPNYLYSICNECNSELVLPRQAKINNSIVKAKHRSLDGLLSGDEVKVIRKKYNLTQGAAADIFGGGTNAFSKYEKGVVIQSRAMDKLLRVTDNIPGVFEALIVMSAKENITISSKQSFVGSCSYGECTLADSKNMPTNVLHISKSKKYNVKKVSFENSGNLANAI